MYIFFWWCGSGTNVKTDLTKYKTQKHTCTKPFQVHESNFIRNGKCMILFRQCAVERLEENKHQDAEMRDWLSESTL